SVTKSRQRRISNRKRRKNSELLLFGIQMRKKKSMKEPTIQERRNLERRLTRILRERLKQQKPELKIGWVWPTRLIFDLKLLSNKILTTGNKNESRGYNEATGDILKACPF